MITASEIQILTILTLALSILLVFMYRKTRGGSKGWLYWLFGMLSYWVGNILAFSLSVTGDPLYESVRVVFLNISAVLLTVGVMVLGRDFKALEFKHDTRKLTLYGLAELLVVFAALFAAYFSGMITGQALELIGRTNQLFIMLFGCYYSARILIAVRYQKSWLLLVAAVFAVLFIILSRITSLMTGIDTTSLENMLFLIEGVGLLFGLIFMARDMHVF